jgi:NAD(P)-dependent dehydrogenase (short-subunit alcohol dehydrogenase family)
VHPVLDVLLRYGCGYQQCRQWIPAVGCTVSVLQCKAPDLDCGLPDPVPFRLSQDGFEKTWAVNVLAPFLLTQQLLGAGCRPSSIINVASISAGSSIDWGNLQQERGFR